MDGDSLDLLCLKVGKRKFPVGMVLMLLPEHSRTVELLVLPWDHPFRPPGARLLRVAAQP